MDDSARQTFETLSQIILYVSLLLQAGIATLAFLRFKTTISGLLIGGGFSAVVALIVVYRLAFVALKSSLGIASDALLAVSAVTNLLHQALMLVVAVGIAFIPSSLDKLASRKQALGSS